MVAMTLSRNSILPAIALTGLIPGQLPAQQREPAIEVFALTGSYFHGNQSIATEWKPQFGGGILAPLGNRWGGLLDITTSKVESYWRSDGTRGAGPNDNFTRERRVALTPSLLHLWRMDRFSIYAGVGIGWEHERQHSRLRRIIARDERGQPVLADQFENMSSTRTDAMLVFRIGTIVSLSRWIVFRADFAVVPRYIDEKASKSLAVGVGYRF